jgi:DNA-binding winged helix-turn-helix (wHTH) protein
MVYRFGDCLLDPQQHRLQRAGQPVRLRSKAFQLLLYLLEHRDRTVLKPELYAQVWPQSFISEATLESTLRAVRQAIGDSGRTQQLIQTVYGYGYRFIGAVEVCADVPRLLAQALPAALTRVLHQRSSGHPLFLVRRLQGHRGDHGGGAGEPAPDHRAAVASGQS